MSHEWTEYRRRRREYHGASAQLQSLLLLRLRWLRVCGRTSLRLWFRPAVCVSLEANSVPSLVQTYVLDLVNGKVGIGWYADLLGLDVNDDEKGVGCVALEQLVDLQIRGAQLGASVVPSDKLLAGVDLLEHVVHGFDVVVVKEPHGRVLFILLERH
jgi:hypothetical protein